MIWNIVNEARAGKTIILTTHSMEEAEVLCQRVAIMSKGTMRCIGTQLRLKQKYANGFRLSIAARPENMARASAFVEKLLPAGYKKIDAFSSAMSWEFRLEPGLLGKFFNELEGNKADIGLEDWGIMQSSLDEVFFTLITDEDAEST